MGIDFGILSWKTDYFPINDQSLKKFVMTFQKNICQICHIKKLQLIKNQKTKNIVTFLLFKSIQSYEVSSHYFLQLW